VILFNYVFLTRCCRVIIPPQVHSLPPTTTALVQACWVYKRHSHMHAKFCRIKVPCKNLFVCNQRKRCMVSENEKNSHVCAVRSRCNPRLFFISPANGAEFSAHISIPKSPRRPTHPLFLAPILPRAHTECIFLKPHHLESLFPSSCLHALWFPTRCNLDKNIPRPSSQPSIFSFSQLF
jgi:hypothetical protein